MRNDWLELLVEFGEAWSAKLRDFNKETWEVVNKKTRELKIELDTRKYGRPAEEVWAEQADIANRLVDKILAKEKE